ncbi:LysR family transcriptional regulator [Herbaspirillum sp.]|uniref:LysR family transcriptional regulator n=1 Tax=Herbaspirillum sp. TaxID=1890675 RepID=UPI001B1BAAAC|nr:LysR family transcriptional regulator [Herbaspirillum sp.]MBO9538282.1 LysR family transcriptional regulator [Herbaspirillum sp.]
MQKFADKSPDESESLRWDDVRYFLELARQGSLSAAARVLGVEHSTVARRVAALEGRIGIRLFDRLPKSWSLTREGEELLEHAARIEEEAFAFSRATLGVAALRGTVRLSAPPAFSSHFIVPRLGALRRRWPGIMLEVIGEAREANLFRREADLALRLERPRAPGVAARLVGKMGYGLYATRDWIKRPPDAWEFIGYDDNLRHTPQQQWLEKVAAGRVFALRANDLAALHQGCRAGLGIAALPHFLARTDATLLALESDIPAPSRNLWLALLPDVRRSPRVKAIAEELAALVQENAALLD